MDLELDEKGFHHTTLVNFRQRLVQAGAQRIGFDAIIDALGEAGLVRKGGRQRLDSTHVFGCVAKMSRLECMRQTIRLLLEQVRICRLEHSLGPYREYRERYCESQLPWHRLSKESLASKAEKAGRDVLTLIRWLRQQPAKIRDHDRALLIERVFLEQYELSSDSLTVGKPGQSGTVQNPHDAQAQWSSKDLAKSKTWIGYKVQVAESVGESDEPKKKGEPTEQFLVEVTTTEAITSDQEGMQRTLKAQAEHQDNVPCELYVDAAYVSDDTLAEAKHQGRELMGPARPPGNPNKSLFDATKFDVDTEGAPGDLPSGAYQSTMQCDQRPLPGPRLSAFRMGPSVRPLHPAKAMHPAPWPPPFSPRPR